VYASGYFERLSAASRPGLVRRAVAGAVGVALAWWVAGALPAFEGDHVSQGVCAIDVVSGGETPILVAPSHLADDLAPGAGDPVRGLRGRLRAGNCER
jgi:hypothetical protein